MVEQTQIEQNTEQPDKLADTQEIELLTSSSEDSSSLTRKVEDQGKTLDWHRRLFEFTWVVIIGVVIVLFVSFIGILISVLLNYTDSVKKYGESVNELRNSQYQFLIERINNLENFTSTSGARLR